MFIIIMGVLCSILSHLPDELTPPLLLLMTLELISVY